METMQGLPADFFRLVGQEIGTLGAMIGTAEEQRHALVGFDMTLLEESTQKQAELSASMRELERERIALLSGVFNLTYSKASAMTLTDLSDYADADQLELINTLRAELKKRTSQLQQLQSVNRVLTQRSKTFIQETTRILTNDGVGLYNVRV